MKACHDKKKGFAITYDDVCLMGGARTPFGKLCGTLGRISPTDLGICASRAALEKSGLEGADIDQVFYANIGQCSTDAYFLARHVGLYSGAPETTPAAMVQRICGSGFETVIAGVEQIALGKAQITLCGGAENMTLSPTVAFGNRMGYPLGKPGFADMLWEALNDTAAVPMGHTAENVARQYGISRAEADEFARQSVERYLAALERRFFKGELIPMNSTVFEAPGLNPRKLELPKIVRNFDTDEHARPVDPEALSRLSPAFTPDGVQTAANSSGIADGAASVVVARETVARTRNLRPLARIAASATSALDPRVMGLGPVPAIRLLLEIAGLELSDIGLFEINEAFAAQYIGCERALELDRDRCNVNGGAIAIGHPLAATGTRLTLTLAREMNARGARYGIAAACIGGGQGTAILLENPNATV